MATSRCTPGWAPTRLTPLSCGLPPTRVALTGQAPDSARGGARKQMTSGQLSIGPTKRFLRGGILALVSALCLFAFAARAHADDSTAVVTDTSSGVAAVNPTPATTTDP